VQYKELKDSKETETLEISNENVDNRHSFQPTLLRKTNSEEEKDERTNRNSHKNKKEVKFICETNDKKSRDTLTIEESHQTAYFQERLTQGSLDKAEHYLVVSKELFLDEISENTNKSNILDALEQKSYQETMMKFKRQEHIRKSFSITNKKVHRRMTYERNILLFICNVAERLQDQQEFFDFEPQNLAFFLYLLAKLSLLHLQSLRDEDNLMKVFKFEEKEWNVYKKSKMYKDLRTSFENDVTICNKFFQRKKKEILEMINEDYKDWRLSGGVEVIIDLMSQNQRNLKVFRETFQRILKKVLGEIECGLVKEDEMEETEIEKLALAEDLMILFAVKRCFKWEDGKELNLNKFVEDRQYMKVARLKERVLEGLKVLKGFKA